MEIRRLREPNIAEQLQAITALLQDILGELRAINGSDIAEQKAVDGYFWNDMRHFDVEGQLSSPYNEFKSLFPTYFTTNPTEVDRD